jgi:RNA polymerase sigma-70 factor (ECF subfamily)
MAGSADEFTALVARVRLGDEAALAALLQHYEAEVRLAARVLLGRVLRCHVDSADLVQSVHHSLVLGLRQNKFELSSPQQLLALTLTMVRRKVARHWRRAQRQQRLLPDAADTRPVGDLLTALSSPGADPAAEAQYHDTLDYLCRRLEERDRQLIELRLQGYSTAEAARHLGVDADVLRVRLSRLRRRLRESNALTEWL